MSSAVQPTPKPARERLHQIDGLRAVAILLVAAHHFATSKLGEILAARGLPTLGNAISFTTNSGVELFFVLSGVVLLRPYMRRTRPFRAGTYFRRRIERLWPPYLAALLFAGIVVLANAAWPTWYQILPPFSLAGWVKQGGIFNFGWPIYNLAWWSLTPELLFYVCAPLVVLLLSPPRIGRTSLLVLIVAFAALSIATWDPVTSMPGVQDGLPRAGLQFLAYVPCFLAGAMLAKMDLPRALGRVLLVLGVVYFAVALKVPRANVHVAFALVYCGVVVVALRGGVLARVLSAPLPVWLGERSYSLFLTHFSVLYLSDLIVSQLTTGRTITYFVVTRSLAAVGSLVLSIAIFSLVERRFARNLVTADALWPWQYRPRQQAESEPSTVPVEAVRPVDAVEAPAI